MKQVDRMLKVKDRAIKVKDTSLKTTHSRLIAHTPRAAFRLFPTRQIEFLGI